jgi:uncharacterized radical SAM superfamily Fe-S cluster-containing enzyme
LAALLEHTPVPPPLQIAGGEPTQYPDLLPLVQAAKELGFKRVELDTNGITLSQRAQLARDLRSAGLTGIYLQFDSLRGRGHSILRGADLLAAKKAAIDSAKSAGLQVVLATTVVAGVNDDELWGLIDFAVGRRLTGINFQPAVQSGRFPESLRGRPSLSFGRFVAAVERQSGGRLTARDFLVMRCSDPRCGALSYVLVRDGSLLPLARFLDESDLAGFTAGFSSWSTIMRSQAARNLPWQLIGQEAQRSPRTAGAGPSLDFFSIGFHRMMDARSWDPQRSSSCCIHWIGEGGERVPFCSYNLVQRPVLPSAAVIRG